MTEIKKKYLLLYLNTGGGHLAPAKSVANCIDKLSTILLNQYLLMDLKRPIRLFNTWLRMVTENFREAGNGFYKFLYALYHIPIVTFINDLVLASSITPYLEKRILEDKPEKIIIFHFFLIRPVYRIIKKHRSENNSIYRGYRPFYRPPFLVCK